MPAIPRFADLTRTSPEGPRKAIRRHPPWRIHQDQARILPGCVDDDGLQHVSLNLRFEEIKNEADHSSFGS